MQIDMATNRVASLVQKARYDDLSDLEDEELLEARTMCMAAIESLSPAGSEYHRAASETIERNGPCRWDGVPRTRRHLEVAPRWSALRVPIGVQGLDTQSDWMDLLRLVKI